MTVVNARPASLGSLLTTIEETAERLPDITFIPVAKHLAEAVVPDSDDLVVNLILGRIVILTGRLISHCIRSLIVLWRRFARGIRF